jgi:hypothetical protein
MTVVDSETPTQSSASGHVFLVYASLLSKLSPCSLFPAGLSVLYVFLFLVAFFAFALSSGDLWVLSSWAVRALCRKAISRDSEGWSRKSVDT